MKNPNNLTNDETTKLFEQAKPFLNQINVTKSKSKEDLFKLFMKARFIDVRVRVGGREYFFEGEPVRWKINELIKKSEK